MDDKKRLLYCFDFDGTITRRDTFVEFIRHSFGVRRCLMGFLRYSPLLVLMKLRLYPNWKAKQRVFAHFFQGMGEADFAHLGEVFGQERQDLARPKAMAAIREAVARNATVCIVSASVEEWVRPFVTMSLTGSDASTLDIKFLCTQVESVDGRLTGHFLTANCYGQEKVRRLQSLLTGGRDQYEIIAFGDSRGDRELLAYADRGHYKPFR